MKLKMSVILLTMLLFAGAVAENPRQSFGSVQMNGTAVVTQGENATLTLFFYNSGNRVLHLSAQAISSDPGWQIWFDPPKHLQRMNVSGRAVSIEENLFVEPMSWDTRVTAEEEVNITRQGRVFPAKPLKIILNSKHMQPGEYQFGVRTRASWFSGSASIGLTQERDFSFRVRVVEPLPERDYDATLFLFAFIMILLLYFRRRM